MKNNGLILIVVVLLFSCEKENTTPNESVYGISSSYNTTQESFIELNLSNGLMTIKKSVEEIEGLRYSQLYSRSKKENCYIYSIGRLTVGILNLTNYNVEKIDLSSITSMQGIASFLVDETSNVLYVITDSYYRESGDSFISLIPIDLKTKNVRPKIDIIQQIDTIHYHFICDINTKNKELYIKPITSNKIYLYNYLDGTIKTILTDIDFIDINYNEESNSLFGLTLKLNDGFYLKSLSLDDEVNNEAGRLEEVNSLVQNCHYFDKNSKSYWIGTMNNEDITKSDIIKIDLINANIVKRITLQKVVRKIN